MKNKSYIIISPDYDYLFMDPDGCCFDAYGDEVSNNDFSFGPRFRIVVPGLEEWHRRYVNATDFANTETDESFDWLSWHYDGLLLAKEIKKQLPPIYTLYYSAPYEDTSDTIGRELEITDEIVDKLISEFQPRVNLHSELSFKNNVYYITVKQVDKLNITACVGNLKHEFYLPNDRITGLKNWLIDIIKGEKDVTSLKLPSVNLIYFQQRIGSHTEMGQFWIEKSGSNIPEIAAYVNTKEFVKGIYLSLMSSYGFYVYPKSVNEDEDYPSDAKKEEYWNPYNSLKSIFIESYLYDITQIIENSVPKVTESYVIFPDYGDCMFWDTMGVGRGNHEHVETDTVIIRLNINGLKEWYDIYDRQKPIGNFSVYWETGWNHALEVRKYLPAHIDLYYMCYDPSKPNDYVDYNCKYPKVLVPHTR